jgi:NADPH2:quinone reductase
VEDPHPHEGQVRIRVAAAGVHVLDTVIRRGLPSGPLPLPRLPMTPGREVAGVVDEAGDGVDPGWVGRGVVADLGAASGGYAELALAPAESLHAVPQGVTADQAVAMIGTGRTTLAILEVAAPAPDDVAVVTAAAGGIGTLLVHALCDVGATVVGAAGGGEKARARSTARRDCSSRLQRAGLAGRRACGRGRSIRDAGARRGGRRDRPRRP